MKTYSRFIKRPNIFFLSFRTFNAKKRQLPKIASSLRILVTEVQVKLINYILKISKIMYNT